MCGQNDDDEAFCGIATVGPIDGAISCEAKASACSCHEIRLCRKTAYARFCFALIFLGLESAGVPGLLQSVSSCPCKANEESVHELFVLRPKCNMLARQTLFTGDGVVFGAYNKESHM